MSGKVKVLDCTLRDGAYVNNSKFGVAAIRGIIGKMQDANVNIIECGWLKDSQYEEGSSYYHVPKDVEPYIASKDPSVLYTVMIDWDRYDVDSLPECDGNSIDAIRVVFPCGKHKEGIEVGERIRKKGYKVLFQAANTLAYSDEELVDLVNCINEFKPESVSIVDTFGAMYFEDLDHIVDVMANKLDADIGIGFHAHNNQQLAFALSVHFIDIMKDKAHDVIVDSTLSGMGRGAGNTTTELLVSYLNKKQHGNYDINAVMDAIDIYMSGIKERYDWGYSTPYFIAGMYQCHVNNIAYLLENHRTSASDMRSIIDSLSVEERRHYDYDLLERRYIENQGRIVDDSEALRIIKNDIADRKVLLIAPGKSVDTEKDKVKAFIEKYNPVVIEVNAINPNYESDYVIFINPARYEYAMNYHPDYLSKTKKILLSNIKSRSEGELLVNFNTVVKRGWQHFDNAVIITLRLMNKLGISNVAIAGFDGFKTKYNESYADADLPTLNPDNKWDELNEEIREMYSDLVESVKGKMNIEFVTESYFNKVKE